MMYGLVNEGGPTYWDQAGNLLDWGFALDPLGGRHAVGLSTTLRGLG